MPQVPLLHICMLKMAQTSWHSAERLRAAPLTRRWCLMWDVVQESSPCSLPKREPGRSLLSTNLRSSTRPWTLSGESTLHWRNEQVLEYIRKALFAYVYLFLLKNGCFLLENKIILPSCVPLWCFLNISSVNVKSFYGFRSVFRFIFFQLHPLWDTSYLPSKQSSFLSVSFASVCWDQQ